jgi:hypothetical protein
MGKEGNFAFGGQQRSYSFGHFWADAIPNSTVGAWCPNMPCEQVRLQNVGIGNITFTGDLTALQATGQGWVLASGDETGWIPIDNLGLICHKDAAGAHLNYMIMW